MTACVGPEEKLAAPAQQSALELQFEAAASELKVPAALLKAIAFVETRASTTAGLTSQMGGHGIMGIVERDDWHMVQRATALTGAPVGQLEVDPAANIRGGAAVLRELADKSFRENAALDPYALGDWYHAVSLYPGYDSATESHDYAAQVYSLLETGFEVPGLKVSPVAADWRKNAPAQSAKRDALGGSDYPGAVAFVASPNHNTSRTSYEFVVIHTMQGSYGGTKSWFLNTTSNVSAQYIVRSSDGEITQMVRDNVGAWHAQCYNNRSIGIEHEGFVQDPGRWYTEAMYSESAKLTRWLSDRYNIPRNRSHIIGHVEVASNCNTGGHTDPGGGWNWSHYMDLVNGGAPTTTTGIFTGAIYTGGDANNRVSGATVTVNGQTQTTGANGIYQFTIAPGSYTATVSKAGFASATVSRTFTAGATVWGSMEINGMTSTGVLRGKVYALNAANPADLTASIDGAVVTVSPGGQTATTGADGNWSFSLSPGTYTVTATKAGYANNSQSRAVVSGTTVWGSVGLSSSSSADTQAPIVAISFPANAAQLDLAVLDLKGTASDDRGAIASVKLSLNGGAEADVPVTAGGFTMQVKLRPGTNTIHVSAKDAAGNAGSVDSTAVFNAGVAGYVYSGEDQAARVPGATLELFEALSGMSVSTATADAMGSFVLGAMMVPADYKVVVRASGFHTHIETVTVGDDRRLPLNIGLSPGIDEVPTDVSLTFTEPLEGSTVMTESVTVYGMVSGFELLSVKINGVTGDALGGGGFSAVVPLKEGVNTLIAEAKGINGETLSGTLHVTRKLTTGKASDDMKAKGGCSAAGGLELFALVGVIAALRRRRAA